jgi:aspartate carbamoyltransferase catalytic subunit
MQHVLAANQFTPELIEELLQKADQFRKQLQTPLGRSELLKLHPDKVVATIFFEPSTRTRLSHEAAALRLGANVISTENANEVSSAVKGETIEDTIKTLQCYADAIVMRHKETGAADRAAAVATVPIINAGDGKGEHPTQGLLDLMTVKQEKGRLNALKIVAGGDLANGRTIRTFVQLMSLFPGNSYTFVSTQQLKIGDDIKAQLTEAGANFTETDDIVRPMIEADVVYWTRLQKERLEDASIESSFVINKTIVDMLPRDAIIMHPLPRVDEITTDVDADPRAAYFRQVQNGLYARMAIFDHLFTLGRNK